MQVKDMYIAIAATIVLSYSSAINALDYRFSTLSTLGGDVSYAKDINDKGQVVGYSFTANNTHFRATLWENGTVSDLGAINNTNSEANAINNSGQVVGYSYDGNSGSATRHATIWNNTGLKYLTPPSNSSKDSFATDINNAGIVVGKVATTLVEQTPNYRAMVWEDALSISTDFAISSEATAINDLNQISGIAKTANSLIPNVLVWSNGVSNLGFGAAFDINSFGVVVGNTLAGTQYEAAMWKDNDLIKLGSLGESSTAYAINNIGQIVGVSYVNGKPIATMWDGGRAIDINSFLDESTLLAGWILSEATGINNYGAIIGNAKNSILGLDQAFILGFEPSPVPAPGALSLMLSGLGVIGFARRKVINKENI